MAWEHTAYHINNYDSGHTHLNQQLEEVLKITFASSSKNTN